MVGIPTIKTASEELPTPASACLPNDVFIYIFIFLAEPKTCLRLAEEGSPLDFGTLDSWGFLPCCAGVWSARRHSKGNNLHFENGRGLALAFWLRVMRQWRRRYCWVTMKRHWIWLALRGEASALSSRAVCF